MAIDWDAELLSPVMDLFGEGLAADQSTLPFYTPAGMPGFRLADAVFDRAYSEVIVEGDDAGSTSRKPCLGVRVSLFARYPAQGDQVFIPSTELTFIVKDVQPDGHGHAKLILMAAKSP